MTLSDHSLTTIIRAQNNVTLSLSLKLDATRNEKHVVEQFTMKSQRNHGLFTFMMKCVLFVHIRTYSSVLNRTLKMSFERMCSSNDVSSLLFIFHNGWEAITTWSYDVEDCLAPYRFYEFTRLDDRYGYRTIFPQLLRSQLSTKPVSNSAVNFMPLRSSQIVYHVIL